MAITKPHNFLSLLSGGKDSTYSIYKAKCLGHNLVGCCQLVPKDPEIYELDSYCFQTIGHNAVKLIAECLEVPLFRRRIIGSSKDVTKHYDSNIIEGSPDDPNCTNGEASLDEVQDLYLLLRDSLNYFRNSEDGQLKLKTPTAVCVGAILSEYQYNRVSKVCKKLGLEVIAPLWQYDQQELLDEMQRNGQKSILCKVCSMGLKTTMLGKTLSELHGKLVHLKDSCGLNVAGEGGEYETFTLYSPCFEHGKSIEIEKAKVIIEKDDDLAPIAHYIIMQATIVNKNSREGSYSLIELN